MGLFAAVVRNLRLTGLGQCSRLLGARPEFMKLRYRAKRLARMPRSPLRRIERGHREESE